MTFKKSTRSYSDWMIRDSLSKVTTLADKEELDMQRLRVETGRIFQAKGITEKV